MILSEKEQIIRKSGILEFYHATEQFSDVGGLEEMKRWLEKREKAFTKEAREFGLPRPKGILLIGVPGCGKSLTAKAVGSLWKLPLLRLDVGKIFAGLVGSSEENMRKAIKTAEAVAPSILWLDELKRGFQARRAPASPMRAPQPACLAVLSPGCRRNRRRCLSSPLPTTSPFYLRS